MANPPSSSEKRALRKVVVVFKTHFDLGFTGLPNEVMALYTGRMFSAVREVVAVTSGEAKGLRYNWTLPAWPLKQLLHDPALPEDTRRAAHDLVKQGHLSWHAWPFTTHTAFCSIEELVRGLHVSRSLSEEFGIWPSGAKQTDVPGHTWIFPSMLVRAGIKFLHLGCNPGSHSPHVPRLFWWEGPDGARLLTWYSPGGYGTPLLPPDDWNHDTWLAVQQTVDNSGPQSPEELRRIRKVIVDGAPGSEVVFGQLGDFAESLLENPGQLEGLPIVPCDLADTWIHGIGTMPEAVSRARTLRRKLLRLQVEAISPGWPDIQPIREIAPYIDAAYEQLLLFGEHTWGLDVKSTIKRQFGDKFAEARETDAYKLLESSWREKAAYIDKAEAEYSNALKVLNSSNKGAITHASPVATSSQDSESASFIENTLLRVEVDPASGGIVSLLDKRSGREWVDKTSIEPFGGYRYDLYSIADIAEFMRAYGLFLQEWFVHDFGKGNYPEDSVHSTSYARNFTLSRSTAGSSQTLRMAGGNLNPVSPDLLGPQISIEITLHEALPYIDLSYAISGKVATHLAESTVVPFPLNLPKPSFRLGQTGSVIDPARDIAAGANHHLWCVDWVDASDDRLGMAIIPLDMPLVSLGSVGIYQFDIDRRPEQPLVYAHLSNTQWATNFPQWLEGDFNFKVRLIPHSGDWREGRVWEEVNAAAGVTDRLPFRLSEGLVLMGVAPQHDGDGLIIRFWDALGLHRTCTIEVEGIVEAVRRCDLMERPQERLQPTQNERTARMEIPIAPHAIETLLIEFGTP